MRHPLIGNLGLLIYLIVWNVIIVAHFLVLYKYYELPLDTSITDALTFNVMLCGVGLSYWNVVKYTHVKEGDWQNLFSIHLPASLVAVGICMWPSSIILHLVYNQDVDYISFLEKAAVWRWVEGLLIIWVIILIYYLIKYYDDLQEKSKNEAQLKQLVKEAELDMLKAQINPHFIFNSLNSISSLTITNPENAQEMIVNLSQFLRSSLGKGKEELDTLKDELEHIMLYLDIEKVRFGDRLKVSQNIPDKCAMAKVPNLILQPLVENAIKYGIYETLRGVELNITANCKLENLEIRISNPYDPQGIPQKGAGIGLKNVESRMSILYGKGQWIRIERENGIFTVTLVIPQFENYI